MEEKIVNIINEMAEFLSMAQLKKLQEIMVKEFAEAELEKSDISNVDYLKMFLDAKQIEGCSERTISYYQSTINHLLKAVDISVRKMTTEDIRSYLADYQKINNCSKVTVDNIRRNISSFFTWLEEEDYILKSPMRRIHKIKTKTAVKEVISDEMIEKMRDNCAEVRDLAIVDLLYSTGMRVGELVNLNISDIDLEQRECVVYGKGDKERRVYFDAKSKIHIQDYLRTRTDDNPALFVTLLAPYNRLNIPEIQVQSELINKILHTDYVDNAGIDEFEHIRVSLRNLMKYLPKGIVKYDTDFTDEILSTEWNDSELENDELKNYKAKAEFYVRQHQDNITIAKLKTNKPLTETDIESLEQILWKEVGSKDDYEKEYGHKPLGEFVREIVGLDMNAAKEAFSEFLNDTNLDSRQIYFVNQIVEYIVHNGMMKDLSVLQESPFTDKGSVVEIFTDLTVWMGIRKVIDQINANAAA